MPQAQQIPQTSFASGEVSPLLSSRTDVQNYNSGLKKARNVIIHPQGAVSNRPGTLHVAGAWNGLYTGETDKVDIILAFSPDEESSYTIQIFAYTDGNGQTKSGIDIRRMKGQNADGSVNQTHVWWTREDFEDGYHLPYKPNEIKELRFLQSVDVLYIFHSKYPTKKLIRQYPDDYGDDQPNYGDFQKLRWKIEDVKFLNGPFRKNASLGRKLEANFVSNTDGWAEITVWGPTNFFVPEMIGTLLKYSKFEKGYSWKRRQKEDTPPEHDVFENELSNHGDSEPAKYLFVKQGMSWSFQTSSVWDGVLEFYKYTGPKNNARNIKLIETYSGDGINFMSSFVADEDCFIGYKVKNLNLHEDDGSLKETYKHGIEVIITRGSFIYDLIVVINDVFDKNPADIAYRRKLQVRAVENNGIINEYIKHMNNENEKPTTDWAFGAFSDYFGYAGCGAFYQDRLVLGATIADPSSLYFSKTGLYEDFGMSFPIEDSDSININLPSRKLTRITNIAALDQLLIFTDEVIFSVGGGSVAITPFNVNARQQSYRGASNTPYALIGNRALFVGKDGILRDIGYSFSEDGYDGENLAIRATHIFEGNKITDIEYQQFPESIVYCLLENGQLAMLTYMREQQILAWSLFETDGKILSITTLSEKGFYYLYLLVERSYVNSSGIKMFQRNIERMNIRDFEEIERQVKVKDSDDPQAPEFVQKWTELKHNVFVDCAVEVHCEWEERAYYQPGQPYRIYVGNAGLFGKDVAALLDGSVFYGRVGDDGYLIIPKPCAHSIVGLPYKSEIETLNLSIQNFNLTNVKGRTPYCLIDFYKSSGADVGCHGLPLYPLFQRTDEEMGAPQKLQSGKTAPIALETTNQIIKSVVIKQEAPLPLTVLGVSIAVSAGDK